jgi:hypothetical protein
MKPAPINFAASPLRRRATRGSTLMLTLVYVLMFAALASSMVAFSQGNVMVQAADTDQKVALMAAESGMSFFASQIQGATTQLPIITEGNISTMSNTTLLWSGTKIENITSNNGIAVTLASAINGIKPWGTSSTSITAPSGTSPFTVPAISIEAGNSPATFTLSATYDPTTHLFPNGSATSYVVLHLKSIGQCNNVTRTVTMDVYLAKELKYAVYSNVAIQLGKNVHVIGDIASTYAGTSKGPPIQMFSDFHYLTNSGNIDSSLATLRGLLSTYDSAHINRLDLSNPAAAAAAASAGLKDVNGDGYIDEWDVALQKFGTTTDPGQVDPYGITKANFTDPTTGKPYDADLFSLIDDPMGTNVSPVPWTGYNDGVLDYQDSLASKVPAKVTGTVKMAIPYSTWQSAASGWAQWGDTTGGTAGTSFNDQFEGTVASTSANPVQFGVDFTGQQTLAPSNFSTSAYDQQIPSTSASVSGSTVSGGNLDATALAKLASTYYSSASSSGAITEHTPADATSGWQATYTRPVFKNVTFNNVRIPQGLNAVFQNCTFNGYTSVKMNTNINTGDTVSTTGSGSSKTVVVTGGTPTSDPNNGMTWAEQMVSGKTFSANTALTASTSVAFAQGNNLHFTSCTFNGVLTGDVPTAYTHFADSWEFDGTTAFNNTVDPTVTIMAPNTNIEMGGFTNPGANPSTLVGVVVAGNIDIRGTANVDGSLIVTGAGAENTTLGYFGSTDQGQGVPAPSDPSMKNITYGHLYFQLNTNRSMPNGIAIPVVALPQYTTYQITD